jgi:hypothetical protein
MFCAIGGLTYQVKHARAHTHTSVTHCNINANVLRDEHACLPACMHVCVCVCFVACLLAYLLAHARVRECVREPGIHVGMWTHIIGQDAQWC